MKNWADFWGALSKDQRTALIDSAAESIGEQKRIRTLFSDLLGALDDHAAGKTKTGMPKVYRQQSAEDLRKALRRHRERLLGGNDEAWTFAALAYLQAHSLAPLCAFLDAFNVPHDKRGTRTTSDQVVPPSPVDAQTRIDQLVAHIGVDQVRTVALALQANNWEQWGFLENCDFSSAQEAPLIQTSHVPAMPGTSEQDSSVAPGAVAKSRPDVAQLIASLEGKIASTIAQLDGIRLQLSNGVAPADPGIDSTLVGISSDFKQIGEALGVQQLSLAEFQVAVAAHGVITQTCDFLREFHHLTHRREPAFPALAKVYAACDGAIQAAKASVGDPSKLEEIRRPFAALRRTVELYSDLPDIELRELDEVLARAFGAEVAFAATRGRLSLDRPQGPAAEESATASSEHNVTSGIAKPASQPSSSKVEQAATVVPETLPETDERQEPEGNTSLDADVAERDGAPNAAELSKADRALATSPEPAQQSQPAPLPVKQEHPVSAEAPEVEGKSVSKPLEATSDETAGELESFESYRSANWIAADGTVQPAPWSSTDFSTRLKAAADNALIEGDLPRLSIYSNVITEFGGTPEVSPQDLVSVGAVLNDPESPISGTLESRAAQIAGAVEARMFKRGQKLTVFLHAFRPAPDSPLKVFGEQDLVELCGFTDKALIGVTVAGLKSAATGFDIVKQLRVLVTSEGGKKDELFKQLVEERKSFRRQVSELYSAAGGRIQRTHCRVAWSRFIRDVIKPLESHLFPKSTSPRDFLKWKFADLRAEESRLWKKYSRIADSEGVAHEDRKVSDRAARELVDSVSRIVDLAERLSILEGARWKQSADLPSEDALNLVRGGRLIDPVEDLCRRAFCALVGAVPTPVAKGALSLPFDAILDCPDLISQIEPDCIRDPRLPTLGVPYEALIEKTRVAAYLLGGSPGRLKIGPGDDPLAVLRSRMSDRQRTDLLAYLVGTRAIEPQESTRLHRDSSDADDEIFAQLARLETYAREAAELISPAATSLHDTFRAASALLDQKGAELSRHETTLFLHWLRSINKSAYGAIAAQVDAIEKLAKENGLEETRRISELLTERRYAEAAAAITEIVDGVAPIWEIRSSRRTIWRSEAVSRFAQPMYFLTQRVKAASYLRDLVDAWSDRGAGDRGDLQKLRRSFYDFVSGETAAKSGRRDRSFPGRERLRDFGKSKITIECSVVRELFKRERANPTYLPQLSRFSKIVLLSQPQSLKSGGVATEFVKAAVSEQDANALAVFLAPGIGPNPRAAILQEFRRRNVNAAIIDDVDLCRLVALEDGVGQDFVSFFEILFEQLSLVEISPFSSLDGQHVQLEMFVGRRSNAEKLARGADITRVFSGRKLGKSAMLKYVSMEFEGDTLPSGNVLHVLFITIAGGESERWVSDQIIDEMRSRFGSEFHEGSMTDEPGAMFSENIAKFIEQRQRESLLIILDEADAFIEGQLRDYDLQREGSLSFKMMKELPTKVDRNGLPRVRVLLSGYRVTNTREGVWANAGDVLKLVPLQAEEAGRLIEGPLARIGVDISAQAPFVARRCGFQPAVLIRFGETLIRRLQRAHIDGQRECIVVRPEDVVATFNEPAVLEEIRTVVNNNFQGNRVGSIVFNALLLACKDMAPGYALRGAAGRVLEVIREIDANLDWLEQVDPSPIGEVERNLRDFIDRQLVVETHSDVLGDSEYRLKFPHFLPVLAQQTDLAARIRQDIVSLRESPQQMRLAYSILADSALDDLRIATGEGGRELCAMAVVGSHWVTPLANSKAGLADRLGFSRAEVLALNGAPGATANIAERIRVVTGARAEIVGGLLSATGDMPRLVIGGVDLLRWAVRAAQSGLGGGVEAIGSRRISRAGVAWWFERARALHFAGQNAIDRIHQATDGVPILLRILDEHIRAADGDAVRESELADAIAVVSGDLRSVAAILVDPAAPDGLAKRELEIIQMVGAVAKEGVLQFSVDDDLDRDWELYSHHAPDCRALHSDPEDELAIKFLELSGLLPMAENRRVRIIADGPAVRLAAAIQEVVS